jgi:hypothetical protein
MPVVANGELAEEASLIVSHHLEKWSIGDLLNIKKSPILLRI